MCTKSFDTTENELERFTDIGKKHVFIIGSKGIPARYGGFETFVDKLTKYRQSNDIVYHVSCMANDTREFVYNNAACFDIKVPNIGSAKAVYYDLKALKYCINYCKKYHIKHAIFYILACRIGPFIGFYKKQIKTVCGRLYVNPDGHEWKRSKWSSIIKKYWKYSEKKMIKHADLLICDSINIERYVHEEYARYNPNTIFIAYGAELEESKLSDKDERWMRWLDTYGVSPGGYYLMVGRFVPENSFEVIIREFMMSMTDKSLVIITTPNSTYKKKLEKKLNIKSDDRIKFASAIYDQELLKKIRENAYGYLHGHTVGGTNPSLLEALGSTDLNMLIDVDFNKEVAQDAAVYWNDELGCLSQSISEVENMEIDEIKRLGVLAKDRVRNVYSWERIENEYENIFCTQEN